MTSRPSDTGHARLAPSSAHRWMRCPGSIPLSEGLPETHSPFAAEGTAAHMLAEKCLSGGSDARAFKGLVIDTESTIRFWQPHQKRVDNSTTFEVTNEMVDAVQTFIDVAREVAEQSDEFEIEQRLNLDAILGDSGGTGDFVAYSEAKQRVTIGDLKYGKGVAVDVEDNEQELTYALGVALRFHNRGVKEVELIIVQPRAPHRHGPVRRWTVDVDRLYSHAMELQDAAARVEDARVTQAAGDYSPKDFNPGSWCKFCKAIPVCGALEQRVKDIIGFKGHDVMGNAIIDDPTKYNRDQLAQKLKDKPLVDTWSKGTEQFAHAEALRGNMPTGFKLVAKRATRKWKNEDDAVVTLQIAGVSDDDIFVTKVASPAALETAIPKKKRAALFDELVIKQSSGTVLAPIDDARPAVDPNDARGFEPVAIEERE